MPTQFCLKGSKTKNDSLNFKSIMRASAFRLSNDSPARTATKTRRAGRRSNFTRIAFGLMLALFFLISTQNPSILAQKTATKADLTPTFWQRDPDADFEDEGRMHCAPTAVSDGLIYLARAFGFSDLVPGTKTKADQIELIEDLAEDFQTDPGIGGTNPDKILTGLQSYVASKGYTLSRLEMMSWRPVSNANRKFKIGTRPDLAWMRSAARSSDTVMIFNFGWYYEKGDDYSRKGGHWVAVVGAAASGSEFYVHNPILRPEDQAARKSITLNLVDDDFTLIDLDGRQIEEMAMKGYFDGQGPGLPGREKVGAAILDAVIVFSLKK